MSVALRTDIVDPAERLAAVRETSKNAKELTNAVGAHLLTDYTQLVPAVSMATATMLYTRLGGRVTPIFNCVVTNIPGPQVPLFSMGSEMVQTLGFGPIVDGLGLFMPILSYNGKLSISATSCREMMPDPEFFSQCIQDTFDELKASVEGLKVAKAKKKTAKTKRVSSKTVPKKPQSNQTGATRRPPRKRAAGSTKKGGKPL